MASLRSSQRQFIRSLSKGSSDDGRRRESNGADGRNGSCLDGEEEDGEGLRDPGSPGISKSPEMWQTSTTGARGSNKLSSFLGSRGISEGSGAVDDGALFRTMAPRSTLSIGGGRRGGTRGGNGHAQRPISERLHSTVGAAGRQDFRGYLAEAQKFQERLHREKDRADKDVRKLLSSSGATDERRRSPPSSPSSISPNRGEGKCVDPLVAGEHTFEWYARLFVDTPCEKLNEEVKSFIEKGLYKVGKGGDKRAYTCLFYMNRLLQMLGCLHHSDELDSMSRTKTQIQSDSMDTSLADDADVLLKFKQSIQRRSGHLLKLRTNELRSSSHTSSGARRKKNRIRNSIVSFSTDRKRRPAQLTLGSYSRAEASLGSGPSVLHRAKSSPNNSLAQSAAGHRRKATPSRALALSVVDEIVEEDVALEKKILAKSIEERAEGDNDDDDGNDDASVASTLAASKTATPIPPLRLVISPPCASSDAASANQNISSSSSSKSKRRKSKPLALENLDDSSAGFTEFSTHGAGSKTNNVSLLHASPASSSPSKTPSQVNRSSLSLSPLSPPLLEDGAAALAAGMKRSESRSSRDFFPKSPGDVEKTIDDFEILEPLSRGAYGRIFLARDLGSNEYVAIKVMRKSELVRKNRVDFIIAEQQIMANVAKEALPFVVSLKSSFQSKRYLFLCMEYCPGGDMLSLLQEMGVLDEDVARHYLAEITLALGALHALGIVHRDIKPDNICIDKHGHVKLTDFGLSFAGVGEGGERAAKEAHGESATDAGHAGKKEDDGEGAATASPGAGREGKEGEGLETAPGYNTDLSERIVDFRKVGPGTPDYMAPEILLGREHTTAVDWWSLGVVAYELMCGAPPFNAPTKEAVFKNIINGGIYWPKPEEIGSEEGLSEHAIKFIQDLLTFDPKQRLGTAGGADKVKRHPFFTKAETRIGWETLTTEHDNVPFVPDIESAVDISYFSPDRRKDMTQVQEPETPLHRKVNHAGRFENFTFTVGEPEQSRCGGGAESANRK